MSLRMITVRQEQAEDLSSIYGVNAASFETDAEARLVDALRAAGNLSVSLVAEENGSVIGHVAFSPVRVARAVDGVGLAPVAVLPDRQGRGAGSGLIREGLAACRRSGFGFVVVLGEPGFYARFGFTPASRWGLIDEYGGGDAFQAMELRAGSIPARAGLVRYAPEFATVTGQGP